MAPRESRKQEEQARVFVVDADPWGRRLVRSICERRPGLRFVGEAGDGQRAVTECRRLVPDVVVLDLVPPHLGGLEVARRLRNGGAAPRILALTIGAEPEVILAAMRAGIDGSLDKSASPDEIGTAIETVAAGRRFFSEELERSAVAALADLAHRAREAASWLSVLSGRQREILPLLPEGLTARQIAERLGVSERTVRSHMAGLYRKLGVKNRVAAINRATELGLIDPPAQGGPTRSGERTDD